MFADGYRLDVALATVPLAAVLAYTLTHSLSRRLRNVFRFFLAVASPLIWFVVSSVLRSIFPVEPGCTQECYEDLVYLGVWAVGTLAAWIAILVTWVYGRRPVD